jgi:hypothetical protein
MFKIREPENAGTAKLKEIKMTKQTLEAVVKEGLFCTECPLYKTECEVRCDQPSFKTDDKEEADND